MICFSNAARSDLAGVARAAEWQGRSLLDPDRPPRAYFYVVEDYIRLGVRERNWKYVYDLREAVEELPPVPIICETTFLGRLV